MTPVSRATTAGRVYLDLQRLARQAKRPTDELFRTYVLERFLWRVANPDYRDGLVLKGGLLLAALGERRPTADVDLLAKDLSNDLDEVAAMVSSVLSVDSDDAVAYDLGELRVSTIRDDDVYVLTSRFEIAGAGLAAAIRATMAHRGSSQRSLVEAVGDLGQQRQGSWVAFVSNAGIESTLPGSYAEVVGAIVAFADPTITGVGFDHQTWNPVDRQWC